MGKLNSPPSSNQPSANYIPVVLMHGIGDAGHNPGMQSLAQSISNFYPGLYSVAVDVADGLSSYTTDIGEQVNEFVTAVRSDPKISGGFHLAGLSQGGLIVRIYAELFNDPPVYNLISLCGPQEGVGSCPGGTPTIFCNAIRDKMYNAPVSFAGYWKNTMDKTKYLAESKWIANWNNERDTKNATYATLLSSVNKYVLVTALNDTVVYPKESEDHAYWVWGSMTETTTFNTTDGYNGDWIGLKTMDGKNQVDHLAYIGEHVRWSEQFWNTSIIPYFDVTVSEAVRTNPNFARKLSPQRLVSESLTPQI